MNKTSGVLKIKKLLINPINYSRTEAMIPMNAQWKIWNPMPTLGRVYLVRNLNSAIPLLIGFDQYGGSCSSLNMSVYRTRDLQLEISIRQLASIRTPSTQIWFTEVLNNNKSQKPRVSKKQNVSGVFSKSEL